jgi:hypothetical protein
MRHTSNAPLGINHLDHDPLLGAQHLHHLFDPVLTGAGTKIPGLKLGQIRSHALLLALLTFRTQLAGFTNHDLRRLTAQFRGLHPDQISTGQATYDLRRLRTHGLIERVPHTHRYRVTDQGLHTAMLITRVHDRFLPTALAQQTDCRSEGKLHTAARTYQHALDALAQHIGLAG